VVRITALPLYHIFALTSKLPRLPLLGRSQCAHHGNPRDFKSFVAELKKYKFNFISGVNTLFNATAAHAGIRDRGLQRAARYLRRRHGPARSGGRALETSDGLYSDPGLGLTETSPIATANPTGLDFNGSIGLPVPSTDISIRDDAGKELPVNGIGEICVFGPQVMHGYWNRPDETEKVMFGDWLRNRRQSGAWTPPASFTSKIGKRT